MGINEMRDDFSLAVFDANLFWICSKIQGFNLNVRARVRG